MGLPGGSSRPGRGSTRGVRFGAPGSGREFGSRAPTGEPSGGGSSGPRPRRRSRSASWLWASPGGSWSGTRAGPAGSITADAGLNPFREAEPQRRRRADRVPAQAGAAPDAADFHLQQSHVDDVRAVGDVGAIRFDGLLCPRLLRPRRLLYCCRLLCPRRHRHRQHDREHCYPGAPDHRSTSTSSFDAARAPMVMRRSFFRTSTESAAVSRVSTSMP